MSEEYIMMQYENEQLKRDIVHWRGVANAKSDVTTEVTKLKTELEELTNKITFVRSENEELVRTNDRIWATTKEWIMEDSKIISKQAGQIKYLVEKVKRLEKIME